ncbi:hypothetical protein ACPF7Z_19315 [Halomonas sp. GXIMD04776]|uniref:hypothetical protein n=1 Tax=Halomonas sp. GXIMD04776 TaxID=3415605 RepID=UPI003CA8C094
MGSKKVDSVKEELIELNEKLHKKLLVNENFYKQLMQKGFAYHQCLLVSLFPDSSNTYCGKLIRQDGSVFEFDIDLDSAEYSSWEDVTGSFRELYERNKVGKPWLKDVVAYDLFYELKH